MKESLKHLTLESSESDSDWRSTNSGYADLPTMIAENDLGTMKRGKRLDFNVSSIFSLVIWSLSKTFNSHGTGRLYTPHGARWQCTAKTFYYGVFDAYRLKLTWVMYFKCPEIRTVVLKMSFPVILRFISGENFFEHFYSTKWFVFEFQEKSLELFLSYPAHFRRYHYFRGFWQSAASSYRDC